MSFGMLIDTTKCVGCGGCALACKEANQLPDDDGSQVLSATRWMVLEKHEATTVRKQCMHCEDPACASVCPVGALQKTKLGPVVYDETKCIGCRYCMVACPFGVPKYEWAANVPRVRKCILCHESRVKLGKPTACASVCPTGATLFGERTALLEEAKHRIKEGGDRYINQVYGEQEVGGTGVMYLSNVDFTQLGFKTGLRKESYPQLTWNILSRLPNVVSVAGVALTGTWWLTRRREDVHRAEGHGTDRSEDKR